MIVQKCVPLATFGLHSRQIGVERYLRIDRDLTAVRELYDHIRPADAVAEQSFLLNEIAVFYHAGELDGAPQLQLPPTTTLRRAAKRIFQLIGGLLQIFLRRGEPLNLSADALVGADAIFLQLLNTSLKQLKTFADWFD